MQEAPSRSTSTSQASPALSTHRDSLTHNAISLGASMWLDDMGPPSASAPVNGASSSTPTSSLEASLQLLNSHGGVSFDEDDSVHALFPMLSEASFDYDDDSLHHHVKAPIDVESAAFPADLSPILTAMPMPKSLEMEPAHAITPRKKATAASAATAIPFPGDALREGLPPASLLVSRKRRRLRSTSLTATLPHWTEHDQNVFFSVLKTKWPAANPSTSDFTTLLASRFSTISTKLQATSQKTMHDVQAFFETVLHTITELLEAVAPHDIDLLNADESRIALRCWHKLMGDDQKRRELSQLDEATELQKKRLAAELRQSIVRSRRQMRKSSSKPTASPVGSSRGLTAADLPETTMEEEEEMKNLEGLLREALEHSSLPSYLYQLAPPLEANATPVVHHPMVRRKSTESSASGSTCATPTASSLKRKRSESVELYHAFTNGNPLQSLTPISENVSATLQQQEAPSFVTPPVRKQPKKSKQDLQTPPQSSRKKIYIKLRMVPRDTQTKDMVEQCGCNPKVELKLSSSKKVSDVLDHMAKKWAAVKPLVDAQATLHFFQKQGSSSSPDSALANARQQKDTHHTWSRRNHDVTCLDMWRQVGKMKNDEYIAVVLYQWRVEEVEGVKSGNNDSSLTAWMNDSTPLLDLFGEDTESVQKHLPFEIEGNSSSGDSSKENSPFTSPIHVNYAATAQVQPLGSASSAKQSLQEFSESVAFDTKPSSHVEDDDEHLSLGSLPEDALSELMEYSPNSQRLRRRRIKPMLVATNECQI